MVKYTLSAAALLALSGGAFAQLAGPDLGPLGPGSSVTGDTSTSTDDNDGDDPGVSGGLWSGGDDVYSVVWPGGDLTADLLFTDVDGDLDLYLYDTDATTVLDTSTSTSDNEQVTAAGLGAGTYYLLVDGWLGDSNTYELNVIPTPGTSALFGAFGLAGLARRRR